MKQIKVSVTTEASPDGLKVLKYEAGKVHELTDVLADLFVNQGWGELAELPAVERAEVVADAADGDGLQTTEVCVDDLMKLKLDELKAMVLDAGLTLPDKQTKAVLASMLVDGIAATANVPTNNADAAEQVETSGDGQVGA